MNNLPIEPHHLSFPRQTGLRAHHFRQRSSRLPAIALVCGAVVLLACVLVGWLA